MNFFSSAVKLIKWRKDLPGDGNSDLESPVVEKSVDEEFVCRDYAKESFSVLLIRPLSTMVMKTIRAVTLGLSGAIIGVLISLLSIVVLFQFGSVENGVISSVVLQQFEKLYPDSDFRMKNAVLRWNPEESSFEVDLNKVRIDDISIPRITLLPDYYESIRQNKLVVKTASLMNPIVNIAITNNGMFVNPDFSKGGFQQEQLMPLSSTDFMQNIFEPGTSIKLINANVTVAENGVEWKLNNVSCDHKIGQKYPNSVECNISLPSQKYISNIKLHRNVLDGGYTVSLQSVNPRYLAQVLAKRNIIVDRNILSSMLGYNLPVTGSLNIKLGKDDRLKLCKFDLNAAGGALVLPIKNILSLNVGKKIDSGHVAGRLTESAVKLDALDICYGNSDLQMNGISIPMKNFKPLGVANIDGTLSLRNISVQDMAYLLPNAVAESIIPSFQEYFPDFKLDLFKVDVKGPLFLGENAQESELDIGHGVFKIRNTRIPLGNYAVEDVDVTGNIKDDGVDIRLNSARFGDAKIHLGEFFLSNRDGAWIGNVNVSMPISDIGKYISDISARASVLPIDKFDISGMANLDLKLVKVDGVDTNALPFKVIEGAGELRTADNTKFVKLSWGKSGLMLNSNINTGDSKVSLNFSDNFEKDTCHCTADMESQSEFVSTILPIVSQMCNGNFKIHLDAKLGQNDLECKINMDLKDATLKLPVLGEMKARDSDGTLCATLSKVDTGYELSDIVFESEGNRITGAVAFDNDGNVVRCRFDEFKVNDSDVQINIIKEGRNKITSSILGQYLNLQDFVSAVKYCENDCAISTYMDIGTVAVDGDRCINNVKGTIELLGGTLVGGACYGVLGDANTIGLSVSSMADGVNHLVSLSASNAGDFLRLLNITDCVDGGSINIGTVATRLGDRIFAGDFEMKDFIVTSNEQFTKLISLSSTNWLPKVADVSTGFSRCAGNFILSDDQVEISNGRMIGPIMCISFEGSYNRLDDEIALKGISLPMSSIVNSNSYGAVAADYNLTGSLRQPNLSVNPMKFFEYDSLNATFAGALPVMPKMADYTKPVEDKPRVIEETPKDVKAVMSADPFANMAFDHTPQVQQPPQEQQVQQAKPEPQSTSKQFGIKITRGFSK